MVRTDIVKIHQLGRKAAFSMIGLARADGLPPTLAPAFEPVKTVEFFFADKNLNYIDRHKEALAKTLEKAIYATFVTRTGIGTIRPEREECRVLIWHFDARSILHGIEIVVEFDSSLITRRALSL
jgi:hypothetical protein